MKPRHHLFYSLCMLTYPIKICKQMLSIFTRFSFPFLYLFYPTTSFCPVQAVLNVQLEDMTTLILGLGVFCQWCGLLRFLSYFDTYNVSGREGEGDGCGWMGRRG